LHRSGPPHVQTPSACGKHRPPTARAPSHH
jgi:hypothetical protein